jgi:hypothetical protein
MNMSNLHSIGGGMAWMAAAALLLLATFEPVKIAGAPAPTQTAAAADASIGSARA